MPERISQLGDVDGWQLRQLRNDDCRLHRQYRFQVHDLRRRRGQLTIRESRQLAQRGRSFLPPSTSAPTTRLAWLWEADSGTKARLSAG